MMAACDPLADAAALSVEDEERAGFYGLVAHFMAAAPSPELLTTIAISPPMQADPALPEGVALAAAWARLQRAAHDAPEVAAEWDALFTGTGRPPVLPYASFYLTGFLMEKPLAALRADLAALGLARAVGCGEPEDHLAGVCDAMRALVARPGPAGWQAQQTFFARHLQPWAMACCRTLENHEMARFYAAVGGFAKAFFALEQRVLGFDQ